MTEILALLRSIAFLFGKTALRQFSQVIFERLLVTNSVHWGGAGHDEGCSERGTGARRRPDDLGDGHAAGPDGMAGEPADDVDNAEGSARRSGCGILKEKEFNTKGTIPRESTAGQADTTEKERKKKTRNKKQ
jgi:hypothetical protein